MKRKQIAKKTNSSEMMISYLVRSKRKTTNLALAIQVAKITGQRPIDYVSDNIRSLALKLYPDLKRRMKCD